MYRSPFHTTSYVETKNPDVVSGSDADENVHAP